MGGGGSGRAALQLQSLIGLQNLTIHIQQDVVTDRHLHASQQGEWGTSCAEDSRRYSDRDSRRVGNYDAGHNRGGADVTLRALELGAVDFVAKPKIGVADGLRQLGEDITDKIRTAAKAHVRRLTTPPPAPAGDTGLAQARPVIGSLGRLSTEKIIFIGASTGGTEATREVLVNLPADAPAVMITQHMPPGFTRSYAARLDGLSRIRVKEATDGERVLPGHAYIAPGGLHLSVERSGANYVARVRDGEPVNRHKPSVEVLFRSAAQVVGQNALGVMLTGMGADGAKAMKEMRDAGSWNVCQDEASCVVFGMPREAIAHGAAHEVMPLSRIAQALIDRLRSTAGMHTSRV